MSGVFREIVRPERLVSSERFDDSWYPGEAVNTLVLTEERGVAASYDRLEELLVSPKAG